ncbi:MAG: hypothetical protein J0M02_01350 [Planctomycetes bacterium]|nr:hypothetical protein [Planctomycetota bacterium]
MFDTFSDRLRQIISNANDEAERAGSPSIDIDHLVAALCAWKESVAYEMLLALGVKPKAVMKAARSRMSSGHNAQPRTPLPFTEAAKEAMPAAVAEARALQMSYTGTEHLLLAIITMSAGKADALLRVDHADAVAALTEILTDMPVPAAPRSQTDGAAIADLRRRLSSIDVLLAASTSLDRTLLDRAFGALAGVDTEALPAILQHRIERILLAINAIAEEFPDARDPAKQLPATALVAYAYRLQQLRRLVTELDVQ